MAKQLPVGGHVEVLPLVYDRGTTWVPAEVIDLLDTQFTAEVEGHGVQFFSYEDKYNKATQIGTWRQLEEG